MATYSALPATLNLVATVGNDFTLSLTVTENGSSWVATGVTLATDIIDSSGTVVATDFTTAASTGTVSLTLTDTNTTTLGVGVYSYRLSVTKSSLTRDWIAGTLSIVEAGVGGSSTSSASLSISNSAVSLSLTSLVAPLAENISVADAGGYYTGTDVEAVLAEQVGKFVSGWPGNDAVFLGDSVTLRGDSPSTGWRGTSFPVYASIISGHRIRYVWNAGVAGNTTAQMLARFDTDVTAYSPSVVVIMGGTNDTGTSVALSTIRTNLAAIVAKCKQIGALPVLCTIPPCSTGSPADRKSRIVALNTWIARYCSTEGIPFVDMYSLLVDPSNGNWLSAYNNDGVHPNNAGDKAMGELLSTTLASYLPPGGVRLPSDESDPHNFLLGGLFTTDTAGLPTSWTNLGGTTGQVLSCVSDSTIKGRWFRYATTASSAQSLLFQTRTTNAAGASVTPGNRYCMVGRVKPTSLSAGQTWQALLRFTGGVTTDFKPASVLDQTITAGGVFYVEGIAPAGSNSLQASINISAGTGQIDYAQVGVYDLTHMGVT